MSTIASLIVRIGANDQQIQSALASVGAKAKSVDADLKKLGGTALGAKADASLKDLRSTMDGITKSHERLAERAKLAAAGLEAMGGVAKLTQRELKQVERTLNEGLGAYEALGKKAPAELQKVADAIKGKLDTPMGGLNAKMIALGTALGTSLAGAAQQVGRALLDSAKATIEYADQLSNLRATTGITIEGLQRLENLGVTSGVSMETLASAVGQLQKKLDDPAAKTALAEMGLNYQRIRNLEPEDQFLEIAKSVAAIKDPVERANAGAAVFGKQWENIAPAIVGDIDTIITSINTMSTAHTEAIGRMGDAWDEWKKRASRNFDIFMGDVIIGAEKAELSWRRVLDPVGAIFRVLQEMDKEARNFEGNLPKVRGFELKPYDPAQILKGNELNTILAESDELLGKAIKKAEDLAKQRAAAFSEQLFNREAIANAQGLVTALGGVENLSKLTAAATKHLHEQVGKAIDVYRAAGREVPAILQEIYYKTLPMRQIKFGAVVAPSLGNVQKTFIKLGEVMEDGTIHARDLSYELTQSTIQYDKFENVITSEVIPAIKASNIEIIKTTSVAQQMRDDVKSAFGDIPEILKSAFTGGGDLLGAAKAFGVELAEAITKPLQDYLSKVFSWLGDTLTGLTKKFGGLVAKLGASAVGIGGSVAQTAIAGGAVAGGAVASAAIPTIASTAIGTGGAIGPSLAGGGGALLGGGAGGGGAILGMTAAQAVPVLGAVALGVYGVVKGVQALKAQAAHKEVNRLREVFFNLQGGLESLNPRVQMLTGNVDAVQAVFDARNPEQYGAALANLEKILEQGRAQLAELQTAVGTASEQLGTLTTVSPEVQAALDNVFDASNPAGYLEAVGKLNTALDEQAAKGALVKDTIAKYGIAFKDSGKQFQQSQINERAKELTTDFKVLREAGVDINAQMRGMGGSVRDFIKDAQAAGAEVPESMREVIQVAIDAGEVFDKDGKKITDMKDLGLTFGSTMETTMKNVGGAVDKLGLVLEALAKFLKIELPDAAKKGAEGTNKELDKIKDPVVTVKYDDPGRPESGSGTEPPVEGAAHGARVQPWGLQHLAGGGFAARGTDTVPAMLTPGELVLNKDQQRALFGATAPVVVNLSIAIDGVFSEGDLVQTVQRRVAPILAQTIEDNVAGSRTRFQDVLGVP